MADDIEEMGPIDYVVLEWPDGQPTGESSENGERCGA